MVFSNGNMEKYEDEKKTQIVSELASNILNDSRMNESSIIMNSVTPHKGQDLESNDGEKNPFDRIENNSLFELEFDMESNLEKHESGKNSDMKFDYQNQSYISGNRLEGNESIQTPNKSPRSNTQSVKDYIES
jgi:hypothetical protein